MNPRHSFAETAAAMPVAASNASRPIVTSRMQAVVAAGVVALSFVASAAPPEERVTPKFSHVLPGADARTVTTVVVELPPGGKALPHRHGDAFVYAYVLSGRVKSALDEGPVTTYGAGDDWFEPPRAHHVLTENASDREPARFLVVFIASTGAALKVNDAAPGAK